MQTPAASSTGTNNYVYDDTDSPRLMCLSSVTRSENSTRQVPRPHRNASAGTPTFTGTKLQGRRELPGFVPTRPGSLAARPILRPSIAYTVEHNARFPFRTVFHRPSNLDLVLEAHRDLSLATRHEEPDLSLAKHPTAAAAAGSQEPFHLSWRTPRNDDLQREYLSRGSLGLHCDPYVPRGKLFAFRASEKERLAAIEDAEAAADAARPPATSRPATPRSIVRFFAMDKEDKQASAFLKQDEQYQQRVRAAVTRAFHRPQANRDVRIAPQPPCKPRATTTSHSCQTPSVTTLSEHM